MEKTVGILTFERHQGRKDIGSSRIRGHWLINNWPEAEEFVQGRKYDTVIYQKAYFTDHAKLFKGFKIFDLCDPDFLHWGYKTKEMIEYCDAVTTSTEPLAEALRKMTDKPVLCIPDRLDLAEMPSQKYHVGIAKRAVWFGYSTNFEMLYPVLHFIKKFKLGLIVISDKAFSLPAGYREIELTNYPFNWKTAYKDIQEGDMVINPQSSKGRWKFKSNNKTQLGWALGMPVAMNAEDLQRFMSEEERRKEQTLRNEEIKTLWDIKLSVEEYRNLINTTKSK